MERRTSTMTGAWTFVGTGAVSSAPRTSKPRAAGSTPARRANAKARKTYYPLSAAADRSGSEDTGRRRSQAFGPDQRVGGVPLVPGARPRLLPGRCLLAGGRGDAQRAPVP